MWSASLEKVPPYSGKQDCNNKTPQSHKEAANCSVLVLHFILGAPQYACSLQLRKDQEVSCVSKHIKTLHKVLTLMQRTFYFDNLGGIFSTQGMNVHSLWATWAKLIWTLIWVWTSDFGRRIMSTTKVLFLMYSHLNIYWKGKSFKHVAETKLVLGTRIPDQNCMFQQCTLSTGMGR